MNNMREEPGGEQQQQKCSLLWRGFALLVFYRVCSLGVLSALSLKNLWSCAFFCLHIRVCHISLKSRPRQSDSWFLSHSVGLLQYIVLGLALKLPVDLILYLFTFPFASYYLSFILIRSFPSRALAD